MNINRREVWSIARSECCTKPLADARGSDRSRDLSHDRQGAFELTDHALPDRIKNNLGAAVKVQLADARGSDRSRDLSHDRQGAFELTDHAFPDRIKNNLGAAVKVQLLHDPAAVGLHRMRAQIQNRRDLLVA